MWKEKYLETELFTVYWLNDLVFVEKKNAKCKYSRLEWKDVGIYLNVFSWEFQMKDDKCVLEVSKQEPKKIKLLSKEHVYLFLFF